MRKTSLTNTLKTAVLATAFSLLPLVAGAAGLGKITVLSGLGQPLRAEIELSASSEELSAISARLASHQAFKQAGIEYVPTLAAIRLSVEKRSGGQPVVRLTTDRPVNEPFLDMLIEINWSAGRLVREYTFLLDPPPDLAPVRPAVAAPTAKRDQAAVAQPVAAPKPPEPRAEAPLDEKMLSPKGGEASEAKPQATEGGKREVKRGEYLRKIAAEAKPDGVSLDQMLVALFRSNKDAFIGNNMHRLKAGKILTIPEREAAAGVTPAEARKVISAQTADFNAYRMKLADAAAGAEPPKEAAARQESAGKITAKVEEKAPGAADAKDQLKVSKSETAKDTRAAQGRIAALEEDLVARDKALKEAQSRQAELERNVSDLKKVLEAKNQNLAELQKQASAKVETRKPEVVAVAPAVAPEPPKPAVAPPADKPAEKAIDAAKPADAAEQKPADAVKPEEAKTAADAPPPPPPPAKKATPPAPPPPPAPEPGFFDDLMDNPAILGGGVLVLGLLGFIAYRQRQKRAQAAEAPPSTTANLATNSVFGATGGQSVDTSASSVATDFSQASISAIDAEEGVDPVAEADVYMAYGRDAQAEEILLDALKTDPTRTAIHVKLLEIYSARKNNKQFETLASDLYAQTGGIGADWEKAAAMGQKLDAANPLYGGGGAGAAGESQSVSTDTTVIMPASGKVRDTWTMPGELGQIADAVENGTATVILDKEAAAAAEAAPAGLDFDLDIGAPAAAPAAQAPAPAAKASPEADLDFDLGLDFKPSKNAEAFSPDATMVMNVAEGTPAPADLDIDLKLGEDASAAPSAPEPLHFDLDLGQATTTTPASQIVDLERTIAGVNVAELAGGTVAAPAVEAHLDLSSINLDLSGNEPAAADEVTTKLELAKAYEEMGDKEGARELLQEVVKEGSADQQDKARGMLARLG